MPYVVKGVFDVAQDLDHRPQEKGDAYSRYETALCVFQKRLCEIDDLSEQSLLLRNLLQEFCLHQFFKTKTLGDGKDEGKNRDNGQYAVIGKS